MSQGNNGTALMAQGRLVWISGDLFKGKVDTVFGTQTPKTNARGETMMQFGFGLAVPKSELGKPGSIWEVIHAEARKLYPNGQIPPSFAMKYKDGDGVDDKGISFAQREGYAGHLVFACTTSLPIKFYRWENGNNILINEGIKCGDYVRVQLSVKAHPAIGAGKAGLYLNPQAVQFLGYGKEIVNTPSGDTLFGSALPPMPPGASATPVAPQEGLLMPTPIPQAVPQAPQPAPAPHYAVVPPQFQPPPGGQPVGNAYPQPVGYPAPAAAATPSGAQTFPSNATNAAPYPPMPGQPQFRQ